MSSIDLCFLQCQAAVFICLFLIIEFIIIAFSEGASSLCFWKHDRVCACTYGLMLRPADGPVSFSQMLFTASGFIQTWTDLRKALRLIVELHWHCFTSPPRVFSTSGRWFHRCQRASSGLWLTLLKQKHLIMRSEMRNTHTLRLMFITYQLLCIIYHKLPSVLYLHYYKCWNDFFLTLPFSTLLLLCFGLKQIEPSRATIACKCYINSMPSVTFIQIKYVSYIVHWFECKVKVTWLHHWCLRVIIVFVIVAGF